MGPRVTSWVLMLVAAVLLVIGAHTSAWFERELGGVTTRVGLRDTSLCTRDGCQLIDPKPAVRQRSTRTEIVLWSGRVGHGVGLAAALAAMVCAMILALRRTRHGAIVVLGLSFVAATCGIVFIVSSSYERAYLGWSAHAFFGGCALAFLSALLALAKVPLVSWETRVRAR